MVGKYSIEISNSKITYFLEVKRNITIIQGDSATGKTMLFRMIAEYNQAGASSGNVVKCVRECIALNAIDWEHNIPVF